MTRIIAGAAGGRRLAVPAGRSTRPTSDRAREGLFAAVLAMLGGLDGAAVLDLYAGSGAVGLEALSRGAADVLLIESDPGAAQVIRRNIETVGLPGARLVQDRVDRALRRGPGAAAPRDLVFADPPYSAADDELGKVLATLAGQGWLARDALVILERDARSGEPLWPAGYAKDRSRRYGETVLWYGRASGASPVSSEPAAPTGA
ncbi:MAG TPA: 16S rRNA (guanine(966)-N(2))-methyltransferase RsmD [Streptosporangiaceae bacterium]|nr:16S rRNA (guanine(966)-N(2))-methyltransferase RsmD [Streptosporangiaceae bacterium]